MDYLAGFLWGAMLGAPIGLFVRQRLINWLEPRYCQEHQTTKMENR